MIANEINRALLERAGIALERTASRIDPMTRLRVWETRCRDRRRKVAYSLSPSDTPVSRHPGWVVGVFRNTGTEESPHWVGQGWHYHIPAALPELLDYVKTETEGDIDAPPAQ